MFHPEVAHLNFTPEQRQALTSASQAITRSGGPEAKGAAIQARSLAERLKRMLSVEQQAPRKSLALAEDPLLVRG